MAVVEGLSSFLGGMGQIKDAISGISPQTTVLGQAFGFVSDAASSFASFISNALVVTLGGLLKDAIESVISALGELISDTIDAGNQFQALQVRLDGINMVKPISATQKFEDSIDGLVNSTKDEIEWIQKMAIITPFTATGIGAVYTMQRAMGQSDQQAKDLTISITNWAAGMALPEEKINLLSTALGRMTSSGKVDGLALRALRAELVPIPEVLDQMRQDLGLTTDEMDRMQKKGKLAPEAFIQAFEEVANKRFPDAANRLAHTWQGAVSNIKDVFANIGGEEIVKPILDVLGQAAGGMVDVFAKMTDSGPQFTDLGQRLIDTAKGIGTSLSDIVSGILGLAPSAEDLGNTLVGGLLSFAEWLSGHKDEIIQDIQGIIQWIMNLGQNEFILGLIDNLSSLWDQLTQVNEATGTTGWQDLTTALGGVGDAIAGVLLPLLDTLGINLGDKPITVQMLVNSLNSFSQWINDNQGTLQLLIEIFVGLLIIQFVVALIIFLVGAVITAIATAVMFIAAMGTIIILFGVVMAVILLVKNTITILQIAFILLAAVVAFFVAGLILGWTRAYENTVKTVDNIVAAFNKHDWGALGKAIIDGIISGIKSAIGALVAAATEAAQAAMDAIRNVIDAHSPSRVTRGFGINIMQGLAQGITSSVGLVTNSLQDAVGDMSVLAMPSMMQQYTQAAPSSISNTYQSNNSYNLAIHSNANHEQVAADFGMMKSLSV